MICVLFATTTFNLSKSMAATAVPTNEVELRVVGMSRSGNHAILHWILQQARGKICFLNCAEPKTNPFISARPMDDDRRAWANYSPFRLRQEAKGRLSTKDWLIYSYEDCFLSTVCSEDFETRHDEWVGASRQRFDLLILRDPFNLFASRLRSQYTGVKPRTSVRIWTQHARQFLGERNYVNRTFVPVNYNRWTLDVDYRRKLLDLMGIPFTDEGFHNVPPIGGGSSFDKRRFDGNADRMNVLRRWRHVQGDEEYRQLFDSELLRLAQAAFGTVENSSEFREFVRTLSKS